MFKTQSIMFVLALTVAAGCSSNRAATKKETHGEEFPSEYAVRSVHRFVEAQAASGARSDAMLYPSHFDAADLNSLGMQKLDLMLMDDDSSDTLMVYLAMPDDEANDRRDSVIAYLTEHGVRDADLAVRNEFAHAPDLLRRSCLEPVLGHGGHLAGPFHPAALRI